MVGVGWIREGEAGFSSGGNNNKEPPLTDYAVEH